jgi:peptide/nickel transport system substrate-binding protein
LNLSVNRKLIIEKIFESFASEVNASVTNEYLEQFTNEKFYYEYDLELAKKNLQQSNCYPAILDRPIELRMRADDENKAKGAVLAQSFKELGLKINILPMEKTKLYKENSEKKGDLTLLTWYIDYDSIVNFIDPILASDSFGSAGNRSFYSNPKVDAYINKIRKNPDENLNPVSIIKEIKEDAPLVFLWSIHENYILSKKANEFPDLIDLIVQ